MSIFLNPSHEPPTYLFYVHIPNHQNDSNVCILYYIYLLIILFLSLPGSLLEVTVKFHMCLSIINV